VALLALGNATQATWVKPKITVQPATLPRINRTTIRIAAPEEFRKHFTETVDKPRTVIAEVAQWDPSIKASALTGGRWNEQTLHRQAKMLTGFLKLPTADANTLTQKSGQRGIFISIQDEVPNRKHITWIKRHDGETPEGYLQRCLTQAKTRTQGLYFRKTVAFSLLIAVYSLG